MAAYKAAVDEFAKCFLGYEVRHIPRAQNEAADTLARLGSERKKVPKDVFLEHLHKPSIRGADLLDAGAAEPVDIASYAIYLVKPDWTLPYLDFLVDQKLPDDEVLRRQIMRRAKVFTIIRGNCTSVVPQVSTSVVLPQRKTETCWMRYMPEFAVISLPPGQLCQKLSGKGSIG